MDDVIHQALEHWGNFYLITGGAAAALTGLQFVVQTLVASNPTRVQGSDPTATIEAFGTPTVVHFTIALLISALATVPWPGDGSLAVALGLLGGAALVYAGLVLRRARRQRAYVPVAEDWIFHVVLPAVAYAAILVGAFLLQRDPVLPEFLVAGATLLLLCTGIHNAWDTVAYVIVISARSGSSRGDGPPPSASPPPQQRSERVSRRRRR